MPFASAKQRGFLAREHPALFRKWAHKYGYKVRGKKKRRRKRGG